ncbi:MAG: NAD(P)/FAD-dependent oxidoreductase [Patescibacteria group bacterium]|nr:NAD(P)/FAD-dependent oxidoreductase [Patescibacteria group bacterium]
MRYDVAVIGGGPGGMMAAGRAGELGARVVLLEKNKRLGAKLLITGKGRCNITNQTDSEREMIEAFGKNGKFLYPALKKFGVADVIDFFAKQGVKTKVERGNRVFPTSDSSRDVLDALVDYLNKAKVEIRYNSAVKEIAVKDKRIEKVVLFGGRVIVADKYILATGGKSYSATGSTGDGYAWLAKMGHTITKLSPALVPIIVKEKIVKELEGLSLKNVEIGLYKNSKKIDSRFGEAIFTADGMSGPIIIDLSGAIGEYLPGQLKLAIDFKPALDYPTLDQRLQKDFAAAPNKMFKNYLDELLPQKLIPVIIKLSGIDPAKKVNSVTREERKRLLHLLKEFFLTIGGLAGFDQAIITSGGVALNEVDPRTMRSKIIDNLFLAGEILDLSGPTGGFNLQACWSTGYVAGEGVINT